MALLKDLVRILRSKNSGAFTMVIDVMFDDPESYERVKKSGVLNVELFQRLYRLPADKIQLNWYDPALAFKATLPRRSVQGDPGDSDIVAGQQAWPLYEVEVPDVAG